MVPTKGTGSGLVDAKPCKWRLLPGACPLCWTAAAERAERDFQRSLGTIVRHVRRARPTLPNDGTPPFTGRYRLGPERAAVRIVVFSDYQCRDCAETERQIEEALRTHDHVSFSHKHFPLCKDCNRTIKLDFHKRACRAARAAEAAGIVGGQQAFWQMHRWLFERHAEFTDAELAASLPELGIRDTERFFQAMESAETLRRVEEDVEEGVRLGATGTPMVFINGVELAGTDAQGAVVRAVAAVVAEGPTPQTAAADRPRPGIERLADQWRTAEPVELPAEPFRWTLGPEEARVRVVLVACHQMPYTPQLSRTLREAVARRNDVRLELVQFPISREHNPKLAKMKKDPFPDSYRMARLAEAAGQVGGRQAFWRMHEWLLDHPEDSTIEAALDAAEAWGLDRDRVAAATEGDATRRALARDMARCAELDIGWAPRVYVDGRRVPGLEPTDALLGAIFDQVAGEHGARLATNP